MNLVFAQNSFCGNFNIYSIDLGWLNSYLESSHPNNFGKTIVTCNTSGSEFKVCRSCSDNITEEAMNSIRPMLASRKHREWHDGWHKMNAIFSSFSEEGYTEDVKQSITPYVNTKWIPQSDTKAFLIKETSVKGESFLFMHRRMIEMVNVELTANGNPCLIDYKSIPDFKDSKWPLLAYTQEPTEDGLIYAKNQLNIIRNKTIHYQNSNHLKSVTLNQLGEEISTDIHTNLHDFYAELEDYVSPKCPEIMDSDDELNSSRCDDLGSNISSHVNRYFWLLHGHIDSFIGEWLKANGYLTISTDCIGKQKCYEWKGTYIGKDIYSYK